MNSCINFIWTFKDHLWDALLSLFKIGAKLCPILMSRESITMQVSPTDTFVSPVTQGHTSTLLAWCSKTGARIFLVSDVWQEEIKFSKLAFSMLVLFMASEVKGFALQRFNPEDFVMHISRDWVKLTWVRDKPLPAGASELHNNKRKLTRLSQSRPCAEVYIYNMAISTFFSRTIPLTKGHDLKGIKMKGKIWAANCYFSRNQSEVCVSTAFY